LHPQSSHFISQVVGLTLFDLRRLGKVSRPLHSHIQGASTKTQVEKLGMVGVNGSKFPAIRTHLAENIGGVYKDMDLSSVRASFLHSPEIYPN
jgi:D-galacturonate reductase